MHDQRDEAAALNNAEWCAAVWRSHGLPVERAQGLWFCAGATPQYYPNIVTVDRTADPKAQAAFIADLCGAGFDEDFSVKDSFSCLDLGKAGLGILFEAQWLVRPVQAAPEARAALDWRRIEDEAQLEAWERVWRGSDQAAERIFRPNLLADPRAHVLGGYDAAGAIRAGGIAYDAAGVLGLTNLFGPAASFVHGLEIAEPGRAMVCYAAGDELMQAERAGFQPLGRLRVWTRRR